MRCARTVALALTLTATHAIAQNPTRPGVGLVGRPTTMPPMPTIAYGPPQPKSVASTMAGRWASRTVTAVVSGRSASATILQLHGLDGIAQAQGLPDGARRLLEMHVQKLRPGEPDTYIVNTQLAADWIKAHPVPADVKPADTDSHAGCDSFSWHCASEATKHAEGEIDKLVQQATDAWNHAAGELSQDWQLAQGCFADATLPLANIPVQFSIPPTFNVDLKQSASTTVAGVGVSGTVEGKLTLGFPIQADFHTELDLFYIPCLPFAVRPKSIAGNGTMTVGEQIKASVTATGKFDKVFTIPPGGGPQIPIEVIPIIIGGVPVAELDVSAYIEGSIEVGGSGKVEGAFEFNDPHKAQFNFLCDGNGCTGKSQPVPDPATTNESASIKGQVFVKPAIFTALQLDFDVDALSARAGPQPFLLGIASGCDAIAAKQTVGGLSTSAENHVLAGDLDWGIDLRAEALIARQIVGTVVKPAFKSRHIWFRDLLPGGSTAFIADVSGPAQIGSGKPATYRVRMPSCYPYQDAVKYHVTWTGNASPAQTPSCQWQSGQGTCSFDPAKDLQITFAWPAAGSFAVTVVPASDDHPRTFSPPPKTTQVTVTVTK